MRTQRTKLVHEKLKERFGIFGSCCFDPRGASAFAGIAVEGELTYQKKGLAEVGNGDVHNPCVIIEDTKVPQLFGHPRND